MSKPSIFIGSSTNGLNIARNVSEHLADIAECRVWDEGDFGLTVANLEAITKIETDFAILILTPDDLLEKKANQQKAPRDNVIFESGFFIGKIGRERTFLVYDTFQKLEIPSDLLGISLATYSSDRRDNNLYAALGVACNKIRREIQSKGAINKYVSDISKEIRSIKSRMPDDPQSVKWILVSGSGDDATKLPQEIENLCVRLGLALAQNNFGVITGGWPKVDMIVTNTFRDELERLGRPVSSFVKQIIVSTSGNPPLFYAGEPKYAESPHESWAKAVESSDACILVEGKGGTLQTGLLMALIGKPVFPIAETNGDARKYFETSRKPLFSSQMIKGITASEFEKLGNPLGVVVDDLMTILKRWASAPNHLESVAKNSLECSDGQE